MIAARTTTVACTAAPGEGGLGRHVGEILDWLDREGVSTRIYAPPSVSSRAAGLLIRIPPARFDPPLKSYLHNTLFDHVVASVLQPGDRHVGFAGQSLRSFRRAAEAGSELVLVSPTAHVVETLARYRKAFARYPIERPWLGSRLVAKTLQEYDIADRIQVASEYVRESLLQANVSPDRIERTQLSVDGRYRPDPEVRPNDGIFRIAYVGGLTVAKGVPVLLDAFARLPLCAAELILVGGWGTRGMRHRIEAALAADSRVKVVSADPLLILQRADVFVHPSFQDGFGYAPMEALACGIPVVVTEDTGMKEHVREGQNGYVVPTGDVDALVERLVAISSR